MSDQWKNKLKDDPIPWLLESNPWTRYRTLTDILEQPLSETEVKNTKNELCQFQQVKDLLDDASQWFPQSITRHNDAKICYYKLRMLADFGLTKEDPGIEEIIKKITLKPDKGLFAVRQTLPEKGKGFEKPNANADEWHALPCDSPLITYILISLGVDNRQIKNTIEQFKDHWETEPGWFCHFFFVENQFKKLQIGCPIAGLMALEVFSQVPELKESQYAKNAFAPLKFHKEHGKSLYYFGRSKKFWTLKYPFVWYNALYLAEVLSRFDFLKKEPLVKELVQWIEASQDENGRFKPTSMYMPYKSWDFSNKKEPSPWMTFLCCRILKRWYSSVSSR